MNERSAVGRALAFVEAHGVVLASAEGPAESSALVEAMRVLEPWVRSAPEPKGRPAR